MTWWQAFLRGIARLVDPFIGRDEVDAILQRSDADALRSDWATVGGDMWWAVREFEAENADTLKRRVHYGALTNVNVDAPRPDGDV